jgi:hypothetical protein
MKRVLELVVVVVSISLLLYYGINQSKDNNVLVSTTGCCSIKTYKVLTEWHVTYTDNEDDSLSYTEIHTSLYDADWAVNEMQDICYTHHFHN